MLVWIIVFGVALHGMVNTKAEAFDKRVLATIPNVWMAWMLFGLTILELNTYVIMLPGLIIAVIGTWAFIRSGS